MTHHNYYSTVLPHTLTGWLIVAGLVAAIIVAWAIPYEGRAWMQRHERPPFIDWQQEGWFAAPIEQDLADAWWRFEEERADARAHRARRAELRAVASLYAEGSNNVIPLHPVQNATTSAG